MVAASSSPTTDPEREWLVSITAVAAVPNSGSLRFTGNPGYLFVFDCSTRPDIAAGCPACFQYGEKVDLRSNRGELLFLRRKQAGDLTDAKVKSCRLYCFRDSLRPAQRFSGRIHEPRFCISLRQPRQVQSYFSDVIGVV